MTSYRQINLYLDRDNAGLAATQKALQWSRNYKDKSALYESHNDLNDYLIHCLKQNVQHVRRKSNGWKKSV